MKLNGMQKVAVLMSVVNRETAARLLRQFEDDEQQRITQAILELENMDLDEASIVSIIDEFRKLLVSGGSAIPNVEKTLSELLSHVHGLEDAKKRLAQLREESKTSHPFRALRGIRGVDLAKVLASEHPQVQALVLTHLDHELAASVLDATPEEKRPELVSRMAAIEDPPARLVKQVAHEIIERTRGLKRGGETDPSKPDPRLDTVAKILLNAQPGNDKQVLEHIGARDESLATRIRERMFEWNDLQSLDRRTMQRVLADIDTRVLSLALKASDTGVSERIFASVSQRTAEMIRDERELLGSVPLKDVLDARNQILNTIRDMMSKGEISVARGKDAVYVT
jgi:flagellar motor switch protein FliG